MGLIASENTIQSELLQTTLAQKGVSAEKSKAILIELGLMNQQTGELLTQKACTKADLEAILAQKGITGAQAEGIISALGLSGANAGLTASFGLLGKAIWGVTKALLSNPITWIVAGFAGLVAITDAVTTSTEEYKEQLDDLKSEYNEITSEIQSVNSELQTTIDRMKELEGKDSLTFTEKEEYDNLVKINNELQRKIDLLELEEKQKNKEKNKTFVDTMVSDTEDPFEHEVNPNGKTEGQYQISDNYLTSETGYIEAQFEIRDQLLEDLANAETKKEKERIQKRIDEIEKYLNDKNDEWKNVSDGISYIENPTTEDDKAVNEWLDYIADFQDRMAIAMSKDDASSNAQYKTNTFNRVVDNWQFDETVQGLQDLGKEGKVTAEMLNDPKYDEFINKLVFLGVIDSADNLEDVALAFNSVADSAENAADSASQYGNEITVSNIFGLEYADGKLTTLGTLNEQVDNIQKAYTGLKSAMDSYNKSGYFTLDQVQEIVSYGDGYLQYLMDEKGNLQLNEEALNKLMVARINEMRVKALSDLYNQVSSIQDETDALAFLEGRLTDVTEATNEYNEAKFQSLLLSKRELMSDEAYSKFESSVIKMVNTTNALFDNIYVGSFSGKGLDDLAKAAKETLESTLAVHKAELDAGIIDLDTYLKKCNGLLNDARDKAIITSAEYWDYQKEVLENQKNVYDKALSAINRRYDKEIDSIEKVINALEKQNEALEKQLAKYDSAISAITKFLDTQKDLLQDNIDGIEAENDVIQDEIDGYDQLLNAVTLVIDAKREAVEADKQAIQDRIDALREENDEAKRAYELEQARFELERLRNSRTKKLYVQGQGYIFDVDHSAIQEQEDSVADLELDATTSALEKEQELLDNILEQLDATEQKWQDIADIFENNKALEKATELLGDNFKDIILEGDNKSINDILNVYIGAQGKLENNTLIIEDYEKRMKQLDAIAKKWENVANIKEETENAINAAELLGKEWQEIVLADRAENYEEFCAKYLEIQSKIDDNTSMIESYEEKVEYYENLKQQWSDIADAYKYAEEDMYLTQVLGSNAEADLLNGRLDTLENFKVQYMATQQAIIDAAWNSANEQNKALASIGSGSTDGKGDISGGSSLSELTQEEIIIIKKTPRSPYKKNMVAQVFHDGIKKGYPNASVPKDKKLETLQKLATEEIPLKNDELPIIARNDELLINEPQQLMLVENYQKLMESMSAIPWNVPIMNTNPLANVGMIKREQPISISIGDIHLHEVQNVPDFAAELNKYLPNISVQYNGRHK